MGTEVPPRRGESAGGVTHWIGVDVDEVTTTETCCYPWCESAQTEHTSLPLCNRHIVKVYRQAQNIIRDAMPELEPAQYRRSRFEMDTPGVVYFIRLGSLVKIGFTTALAQRLRDLPFEEVLGVKPGTMRDEKDLHSRFGHLRQTGEWFRAEPDLLDFIASVSEAA